MVDKVSVLNPANAGTIGSSHRASAADLLQVANQSQRSDPFKGLNLDQLTLSDDARQKIVWARTQFELSYQVIRSLNTSQGERITEESFSFSGSIEFLQRVSGRDPVVLADPTAQPEAGASEDLNSTTSADALSALQEYFSPEKTAERILDVALSFFGVSETQAASGNTPASRQTFADFIGKAIEEGFTQARSLLGQLPEAVETGVSKTHSLVFDGLADFVQNGINPEKLAPGGVMEKIARYRREATENMDQIRKTTSAGGYNARGEPAEPSDKTPNVSRLG
ncbi:MAG TPA: DUF5610 domain-containing protein [Candidatus Ozemobacteraceae bacterium]|nr:DUF5610 domain-containing protein [Candidatus Ozemobacteraceae bacterium]